MVPVPRSSESTVWIVSSSESIASCATALDIKCDLLIKKITIFYLPILIRRSNGTYFGMPLAVRTRSWPVRKYWGFSTTRLRVASITPFWGCPRTSECFLTSVIITRLGVLTIPAVSRTRHIQVDVPPSNLKWKVN